MVHGGVSNAGSTMSGRPRVGFVGGAERLAAGLLEIGDQVGVDVEVHDGKTRGNGAAQLAALVRRTQLVVLITGTNSHNAVHVAKREASRWGVPLRILRSCGLGTARALLTEVVGAHAA
jgi:hypothetical protein